MGPARPVSEVIDERVALWRSVWACICLLVLIGWMSYWVWDMMTPRTDFPWGYVYRGENPSLVPEAVYLVLMAIPPLLLYLVGTLVIWIIAKVRQRRLVRQI